jgi:hypothetical protein
MLSERNAEQRHYRLEFMRWRAEHVQELVNFLGYTDDDLEELVEQAYRSGYVSGIGRALQRAVEVGG